MIQNSAIYLFTSRKERFVLTFVKSNHSFLTRKQNKALTIIIPKKMEIETNNTNSNTAQRAIPVTPSPQKLDLKENEKLEETAH